MLGWRKSKKRWWSTRVHQQGKMFDNENIEEFKNTITLDNSYNKRQTSGITLVWLQHNQKSINLHVCVESSSDRVESNMFKI